MQPSLQIAPVRQVLATGRTGRGNTSRARRTSPRLLSPSVESICMTILGPTAYRGTRTHLLPPRMSRLRMAAPTMMPPAQRLRPRTGPPLLPPLLSRHTLLITSNSNNSGNSNSSHRRGIRLRRSRQKQVSTNGSTVVMSPHGSLLTRSRTLLRETTATLQRPRELRRLLLQLLPRLRRIGRRTQITPTRRAQHQANASQGVASPIV